MNKPMIPNTMARRRLGVLAGALTALLVAGSVHVGNVVFACGAIVEDDGEVKVYYGAADTSICVAIGVLDEIVDACFNRTEE